MAFIIKYRYALMVIAVLAGINIYGWWKEKQGEEKAETKNTIEKLTDENNASQADNATRKKQNEIIVRDITPSDFDSILQNGAF
jgi:uncharacterized protein HemX